MAQGIVGARIRARRQSLGLTQAALAQRLGISHSYLNLIERNKRGIGGKLLNAVAAELGIRRDELDGAAERRLYDHLAEIAADPRHAELALDPTAAGEIVGRYPGWARALTGLARSERALTGLARALSDRLTHDPFLGEAVHRMLTHTAALRAAAEILRDVPDLDAADRERFTAIVAEESARLSEVGTALAGYFDRSHDASRAVTPGDEVEQLFEARANHFAELETAAAPGDTGRPRDALLAGAVDRTVAEAEALASDEARALARERLTRYARDAAAAPLGPLAAAAEAERYDVELVAARLGVGVEVVIRRLACLPAAPGRPRFGYIETNAAGVATEYRAVPGLAPPRHGSPCPIWINHRAPARPGECLRQVVEFPTGLRLLFVARARPAAAAGFGRLVLPVVDMLVVDAQAAEATVYGAAPMPSADPVGQSCRICPRETCAHRVTAAAGG